MHTGIWGCIEAQEVFQSSLPLLQVGLLQCCCKYALFCGEMPSAWMCSVLPAGLSCEGLVPFCAIYSTFLQRGYDQVVHDVALQKLPGGTYSCCSPQGRTIMLCLPLGGPISTSMLPYREL